MTEEEPEQLSLGEHLRENITYVEEISPMYTRRHIKTAQGIFINVEQNKKT